jgi:hypothetical protein
VEFYNASPFKVNIANCDYTIKYWYWNWKQLTLEIYVMSQCNVTLKLALYTVYRLHGFLRNYYKFVNPSVWSNDWCKENSHTGRKTHLTPPNYRLFGTTTIRVPDNSAPFATIRYFGNDDSGLDVYNNLGLWQRQFGTSIRTLARNYRLFGTATIWVPFIQIVVNCHFYGIKHILVPSPKSSLSKSRIVVTKVLNCRLYRVPNCRVTHPTTLSNV